MLMRFSHPKAAAYLLEHGRVVTARVTRSQWSGRLDLLLDTELELLKGRRKWLASCTEPFDLVDSLEFGLGSSGFGTIDEWLSALKGFGYQAGQMVTFFEVTLDAPVKELAP